MEEAAEVGVEVVVVDGVVCGVGLGLLTYSGLEELRGGEGGWDHDEELGCCGVKVGR